MRTRMQMIVSLMLLLMFSACAFNRPVCATSNPVGKKVGVYTQTGFLFFPPPYNSAIATAQAADNGGITRISTVDYNIIWLLIVVKYETVVTGE